VITRLITSPFGAQSFLFAALDGERQALLLGLADSLRLAAQRLADRADVIVREHSISSLGPYLPERSRPVERERDLRRGRMSIFPVGGIEEPQRCEQRVSALLGDPTRPMAANHNVIKQEVERDNTQRFLSGGRPSSPSSQSAPLRRWHLAASGSAAVPSPAQTSAEHRLRWGPSGASPVSAAGTAPCPQVPRS
jgi:hypothetical protein